MRPRRGATARGGRPKYAGTTRPGRAIVLVGLWRRAQDTAARGRSSEKQSARCRCCQNATLACDEVTEPFRRLRSPRVFNQSVSSSPKHFESKGRPMNRTMLLATVAAALSLPMTAFAHGGGGGHGGGGHAGGGGHGGGGHAGGGHHGGSHHGGQHHAGNHHDRKHHGEHHPSGRPNLHAASHSNHRPATSNTANTARSANNSSNGTQALAGNHGLNGAIGLPANGVGNRAGNHHHHHHHHPMSPQNANGALGNKGFLNSGGANNGLTGNALAGAGAARGTPAAGAGGAAAAGGAAGGASNGAAGVGPKAGGSSAAKPTTAGLRHGA